MGGSLEIFNLACKCHSFQSRLKISIPEADLDFFQDLGPLGDFVKDFPRFGRRISAKIGESRLTSARNRPKFHSNSTKTQLKSTKIKMGGALHFPLKVVGGQEHLRLRIHRSPAILVEVTLAIALSLASLLEKGPKSSLTSSENPTPP